MERIWPMNALNNKHKSFTDAEIEEAGKNLQTRGFYLLDFDFVNFVKEYNKDFGDIRNAVSAYFDQKERVESVQQAPLSPLRPPVSLLVKLGSLAIHVEELLSPGGHAYDKLAMDTLLGDAELREWLKQMSDQAFLPVPRTARA